MATADDERSPYESGADEERFCKWPFQPEIPEEPQNVSHEAGKNNSTGESEFSPHEVGNFATISATIGISELEQILIHKTFTRTYDYKVVKLALLSGLCGPKLWLQTEIYSMRKVTWELITERFPSHITYIIDCDHLCADGCDGRLHWLCCIDVEDNLDRIVAFDLGSETFREIPLPHPTVDYECDITLGVLAGKLCVMSWFEDDGTCEVWVMDEYGVPESWVKQHVFSQIIGFSYAFGFTSGNKFLIQDKNGGLVLYDPSANEQKILKDHCLRGYRVDKIVEYVDSLVWVAPVEHEMVDGA